MKIYNIAIDGPSGSGKSTISKILANKLEINYLDTGAMYRAIGYKALESEINIEDPMEIQQMLDQTIIEYENHQLKMDGKIIGDEIRTSRIAQMGSKISAYKEVREFLLGLQRQIASSQSSILDGRDIGTVVLPNAKYKFYLNATPEERAKRRYQEFKNKGQDISYQQVYEDIQLRDKNDSTRKHSPLRKADDAIEIDSTNLTIEEVVRMILSYIEE